MSGNCDDCDALPAVFICEACEQKLCADCEQKLHKKGKRVLHQRRRIDEPSNKPVAPAPIPVAPTPVAPTPVAPTPVAPRAPQPGAPFQLPPFPGAPLPPPGLPPFGQPGAPAPGGVPLPPPGLPPFGAAPGGLPPFPGPFPPLPGGLPPFAGGLPPFSGGIPHPPGQGVTPPGAGGFPFPPPGMPFPFPPGGAPRPPAGDSTPAPTPFGGSRPGAPSVGGAPVAPRPSPFGDPFGAGARPSPFGDPVAGSRPSPFGDPPAGGSARPSPFGDPAAPVRPSPFGDPSGGAAAPRPSPFGDPAGGAPVRPSPFGDPSGGSAAAPARPSPFGDPIGGGAAQVRPSPFGDAGHSAVRPSPFGDPGSGSRAASGSVHSEPISPRATSGGGAGLGASAVPPADGARSYLGRPGSELGSRPSSGSRPGMPQPTPPAGESGATPVPPASSSAPVLATPGLNLKALQATLAAKGALTGGGMPPGGAAGGGQFGSRPGAASNPVGGAVSHPPPSSAAGPTPVPPPPTPAGPTPVPPPAPAGPTPVPPPHAEVGMGSRPAPPNAGGGSRSGLVPLPVPLPPPGGGDIKAMPPPPPPPLALRPLGPPSDGIPSPPTPGSPLPPPPPSAPEPSASTKPRSLSFAPPPEEVVPGGEASEDTPAAFISPAERMRLNQLKKESAKAQPQAPPAEEEQPPAPKPIKFKAPKRFGGQQEAPPPGAGESWRPAPPAEEDSDDEKGASPAPPPPDPQALLAAPVVVPPPPAGLPPGVQPQHHPSVGGGPHPHGHLHPSGHPSGHPHATPASSVSGPSQSPPVEFDSDSDDDGSAPPPPPDLEDEPSGAIAALSAAYNSPAEELGSGSRPSVEVGSPVRPYPLHEQKSFRSAGYIKVGAVPDGPDGAAGKVKCAMDSCMSFAARGKWCLRHAWKNHYVEKDLSKQEKVARELVSTERTYQKGLDIIVNTFMKRLWAMEQMGRPLMTGVEMSEVFGNIEEVYKLSNQMAEDLEEIRDKECLLLQVGLTLQYHSQKFRVYQQYMENYDVAIEALKKYREANPSLHFFIEMNERCLGQGITSYLIMPIQRLPRYILLLQELIKNTPEEDSSKADLLDAFETIKRIADAINHSLHTKVAFGKVKQLEEMFEKDERFQPLANGTRYLVKQGPLKKRFSKKSLQLSDNKAYSFFLFNDVLVYASATKTVSGFMKRGQLSGVKYKMKHFLPLDDMKVQEVWSPKSKEKEIQIISGKRELMVAAEDMAQHAEWISVLNATIEKLRESRYEMDVQNFDGAPRTGKPKSSKLAHMLGA